MRNNGTKMIRNGTKGSSGFTLVEVMIAMAIFFVGVLAIARLQTTTARSNVDARKLGEATKIAREIMEEMDLLRTFYITETTRECINEDLYLSNDANTRIQNSVTDPEAEGLPGYPACPGLDPFAVMADDLDLDAMLESDMTDAAIAATADRCLRRAPDQPCAPVDAFFDFDAPQAPFWVAWNIRGHYPDAYMNTIKLYVWWYSGETVQEGIVLRRRWTSVQKVMTAKDTLYYY